MAALPSFDGWRKGVVVDTVLQYWTHYGQSIGIVGDIEALGCWNPKSGVACNYEDGALWRGRFTVPEPCVLRYKYFLLQEDGTLELEWGHERVLVIDDKSSKVELRETWRSPGIFAGFFHSSMGRYTFGRSPSASVQSDMSANQLSTLLDAAVKIEQSRPVGGRSPSASSQPNVRLQFKLHEPRVYADSAVVVCGNIPELGSWDPRLAPVMDGSQYPLWTLQLSVPASQLPLEYKFVILPTVGTSASGPAPSSSSSSPSLSPEWEDGDNRRLEAPEFAMLGALSQAERAELSKQLLASQPALASTSAPWSSPPGLTSPPGGGGGAGSQTYLTSPQPVAGPQPDPLRDYSAYTWVRRPKIPQQSMSPPFPVPRNEPLQPSPLPDYQKEADEQYAQAAVAHNKAAGEHSIDSEGACLASGRREYEPLAAIGQEGGPKQQLSDVTASEALGNSSIASPVVVAVTASSSAQVLLSPTQVTSGQVTSVPHLEVAFSPHQDDPSSSSSTFRGQTLPSSSSSNGLPLGLSGSMMLTSPPMAAGTRLTSFSSGSSSSSGSAAAAQLAMTSPLIITHSFMMRMESRAWRASSLCVPLFSLRSDHGLGVGEFTDLPALVDWAASVGIKMVHLLPVNDTTSTGTAEDSSPYRITSAFALHPLYLNFDAILRTDVNGSGSSGETMSLGSTADGVPIASLVPQAFLTRLDTARAQLNGTAASSGSSLLTRPGSCYGSRTGAAGLGILYNISDGQQTTPQQQWPNSAGTPAGGGGGSGSYYSYGQLYGRAPERYSSREPLDYEQVMRLKMALLRDLYRVIGDAVLATPGFSRWFRNNRDWLQPYALYCFFRDLHGTADTSHWGARSTITQAQVHSLTDASQFHYKAVAFWYFGQYLLHTQLAAASAHASSQGVLLQVDLPFGLPRGSADVWANPSLFKLDRAVGSPPDPTGSAPYGRRSEVVPYDWDKMTATTVAQSSDPASKSSTATSSSGNGSGAPLLTSAGAAWWGRRLRLLGTYFPSVRLTQVADYFRAYELPASAVTGLGGVFAPSPGFTEEELEAAGIDVKELLPRLTQPHVREWTARAALGPNYADMVRHYFEIDPSNGCYAFKTGLTSEAAIKKAFDAEPALCAKKPGDGGSGGSGAEDSTTHLYGLIQLLQNVCLIEVVEPAKGGSGGKPRRTYHPRTDMQKTTSFLELPEAVRKTLAQLYALYFTQRAPSAWRAVGRSRMRLLQSLSPDGLFLSDDPLPRAGITDILYSLGILGVRSHRLMGDDAAAAAAVTMSGGPGRLAFEYGCVALPSSSDMGPLRSWWEEDASLSARFYYAVLGQAGPAPASLTPEVAALILRLYASSGAKWTEFLLQDLLAADAALRSGGDAHSERINVPSNPRHVWRWRMGVTLEELQGDLGAGLKRQIAALLAAASRLPRRPVAAAPGHA